ncbi:DUF92 domain-containing protein [Granulicella sp. WH15]|uniref:DUF92 domain-containing protein n=1 Tax=Granulicella sp. WH15 TaxID=2602070 RepID=UPI0013A55334|nr:DUF92 domain-containing protein [Granulicella sp. WH15]
MAAEPNVSPQEILWRKPIPLERDRRQSSWLVAVVGVLLAALCAETILWAAVPWRELAVSAIFALSAWRLRAATPAAAVAGGSICLLLTFWTASGLRQSVMHTALTPLLALFVITFSATRAGKRRKIAAGLAEGRRGRSASQIIANLGAAGLFAALPVLTIHRATVPLFLGNLIRVLALAALAEATADTVSSEIGQAFGGRPFLLTSLRRVEPGTDGAVSLLGTVAGVVSAALVALVGAWAMFPQVGTAAGIALLGGVAGLVFDSLLGATIERKGWLGNDLVNFTSTVFAAVIAYLLFRMI